VTGLAQKKRTGRCDIDDWRPREVAEVYPDLVARTADGQIETVKYQVLDSMLLNVVQREAMITPSQAAEQHANADNSEEF